MFVASGLTTESGIIASVRAFIHSFLVTTIVGITRTTFEALFSLHFLLLIPGSLLFFRAHRSSSSIKFLFSISFRLHFLLLNPGITASVRAFTLCFLFLTIFGITQTTLEALFRLHFLLLNPGSSLFWTHHLFKLLSSCS